MTGKEVLSYVVISASDYSRKPWSRFLHAQEPTILRPISWAMDPLAELPQTTCRGDVSELNLIRLNGASEKQIARCEAEMTESMEAMNRADTRRPIIEATTFSGGFTCFKPSVPTGQRTLSFESSYSLSCSGLPMRPAS